jgi:hypothetical protein
MATRKPKTVKKVKPTKVPMQQFSLPEVSADPPKITVAEEEVKRFCMHIPGSVASKNLRSTTDVIDALCRALVPAPVIRLMTMHLDAMSTLLRSDLSHARSVLQKAYDTMLSEGYSPVRGLVVPQPILSAADNKTRKEYKGVARMFGSPHPEGGFYEFNEEGIAPQNTPDPTVYVDMVHVPARCAELLDAQQQFEELFKATPIMGMRVPLSYDVDSSGAYKDERMQVAFSLYCKMNNTGV